MESLKKKEKKENRSLELCSQVATVYEAITETLSHSKVALSPSITQTRCCDSVSKPSRQKKYKQKLQP